MLWNDLPLHIKQSPSVDIFKSRIKTRLFQLAYFIWLCKCMYVYFMLSIMNRLGLTRSYVTCTFASALVSKGQISIWHICLILKLALYKYHIIIIIISLCLDDVTYGMFVTLVSWWRHQMETFSALLALCAGNSPVPGEFPTQRPVTRSFDVYFDLHSNKRLGKQSWGWWFETLSWSLWRHRNVLCPIAEYINPPISTRCCNLQVNRT